MTDRRRVGSSALFNLYPGTHYDGPIVRYPYDTDARLEYCFADAADRLASTYQGRPQDDAILYPWLYLYRHAIELALKESIWLAARLRRNNGETDERLETEAVRLRLRTKDKHSIGALVHELNTHLAALDQPLIPKDAMKMLTALATADPAGEAFRYTGGLPDSQDAMDFHELNAAVKEAYGMTSATYDVLDEYASVQADWLEDMRQIQAEYDAEMRAEYGEPLYVATKVPPKNGKFPAPLGLDPMDVFPGEWIRENLKTSLRASGLDAFDVLQFHVWSDEWVGRGDWLETVDALKQEGTIRAFGVSINDLQPENAIELIRTGTVDTVQVISTRLSSAARGAASAGVRRARRRRHRAGRARRGRLDRAYHAGHPVRRRRLAQRLLRRRPTAAGRRACRRARR